MGKPIREDVRAAAHRIWNAARIEAGRELGDQEQAAELLETAVVRVSHYLDRKDTDFPSGRVERILRLTFRRAVRRLAAKRRRIEFQGGTQELALRVVDRTFSRRADASLDLERLASYLSKANREILSLWSAGYTWREIAAIVGSTASAVRSSFWRNVRRARSRFI